MSPLTKDTCSPCLRGQHVNCTTPDACKCVECYPPPAPKFVWEEPPASTRGRKPGSTVDADVLVELRAHPKRWARVRTFTSKTSATTLASKVNTGKVKPLPSSEWEAIGRRLGATGSALYLRYVGKDAS